MAETLTQKRERLQRSKIKLQHELAQVTIQLEAKRSVYVYIPSKEDNRKRMELRNRKINLMKKICNIDTKLNRLLYSAK